MMGATVTTARQVPRTSEERGSLLADSVVGAARLSRAALRAVRRRLGDGAGPQLASHRAGRRGAGTRLLDDRPAAEGRAQGHPAPEPGVGPIGPRVYGAADRRAGPPEPHELPGRRRVTAESSSGVRATQRAGSAARPRTSLFPPSDP